MAKHYLSMPRVASGVRDAELWVGARPRAEVAPLQVVGQEVAHGLLAGLLALVVESGRADLERPTESFRPGLRPKHQGRSVSHHKFVRGDHVLAFGRFCQFTSPEIA